VLENELDTTPPELGTGGGVLPSLATTGMVLTATFEASEPLSEDPQVQLDAGDGVFAPFQIEEGGTDRGASQWRFNYIVNGTEAEGVRNVLVSLTDQSGLHVDGVVLGTVELDFSAPGITDPVVSPDVVRAGIPIEISFSTTEALEAVPALTVSSTDGSGSAFTLEDGTSTDNLHHQFGFEMMGTEPEGLHRITARLSDAVGNTSELLEVGTLWVDFSPPALDGEDAVSIVPPSGAPGRRINVEVVFDEAVVAHDGLFAVRADDPMVEIEFEITDSTERILRFIHIVDVGEDGGWNLEFRGAEDLAGNLAPVLPLGTVLFDGTAPELVNFTQSHTSLLSTDTLTVTFETSEPTAAEPTVLLGNVAMTRHGSEVAPYTYVLDMSSTGLSGTYQFNIRLIDAEDNEGVYHPGTVDVDALPPGLVDVVFTPPAARLNTTAILTVTATEPLSGPPSLQWAQALGDPGFTYLDVSGLGHQFALSITPQVQQGIYEIVEMELTDLAGNSSFVDTTSFFAVFNVDNEPPLISNLETDAQVYSAQDGFNEIVATFDVDEEIDSASSNLQVTLGANAFACDPRSPTSPNYTCRYTISDLDAEGLAVVNVLAIDPAGNDTSASTSIVLDMTAPGLAAFVFSPELARLGSEALLIATSTEPLVSAPALNWAIGGGDPGFVHQGVVGLSHTWGFTVDGTTPLGPFPLDSVVLTDLYGNTTTVLGSELSSTFEVDNHVPTLSNLSTSATTYSQEPVFNDFVLSFDSDKNLDDPDSTLEVKLGDSDVPCGLWQPVSPTYTCTRAIDSNDEEGFQAVSVRAVDSAGNEDNASTGVTLDFTPPAIAQGSANTALHPGPGNLLDSVIQAKAGTQISVTFAVSETLGENPVVSTSAPEPLVFANANVIGNFYTYEHVLSSSPHAQGLYALTATLTDPVGNTSAPLTLPGFTVDTLPPNPIVVDNLTYRRIPWGSDATGGEAEFTLEAGAAGTFENNATVIVWDEADISAGNELGRSQADATGALTQFDLNRADRPRVYVLQLDGAGNASGNVAALVPHISWVATLGGKVAGSFFANPLTYRKNGSLGGILAAEVGVEFGAESGVDDQGANFSTVEADGSWRQVAGSVGVGVGKGLSKAEDTVRGRVVVFGNNGIRGTLEWDGSGWQTMFPTDPEGDGNPPDRTPASNVGGMVGGMAFDPIGNRSILMAQGTWAWNGQSWEKLIIDDPEGDGEPLHKQTKIAYDPDRDRFIAIDDVNTWEWDRASWKKIGPSPHNTIYYEDLVYDIAQGEMLAFTGSFSGPTITMMRLTDMGWQTFTSGNGVYPDASAEYDVTFDRTRGKVVLFGGRKGFSADYNTIWEWDGTNWTEIPATNRPIARSGSALAWDPVTGLLVIAGGGLGLYNNTNFKTDSTWVLDGTRWRRQSFDPPITLGQPTGEVWSQICYDAPNERLIHHGGLRLLGSSFSWVASDDTWYNQGETWRVNTGEPTGNLCYGTLLCDPVTGDIIMQGGFGGTGCDTPNTTSWRLTDETWTQEATGITTPLPNYPQSIVYYPPLSTFVWYRNAAIGGNNDFWRWDGSDWVVHPALGSPGSVGRPSLAYDVARDRLVLWGGLNAAGNAMADPSLVHEGQSNGTWTTINATDPEGDGHPRGRRLFGIGYDPGRQRILMVGGCSAANAGFVCAVDQLNEDTWEWDGTSWRKANPTDPHNDGNPGPGEHTKILDVNGRVRMIGNQAGLNSENIIWEWDGGTLKYPAHRVEVPFVAASDTGGVINRVEINAQAAGTSPGQNGATLRVWARGTWDVKDSNTASPGSPAALQWVSANAFEAQRAFTDVTRSLHFAVTSQNTRGNGEGEAELDYFEVQVDYTEAP
jgi:hypothetical protein